MSRKTILETLSNCNFTDGLTTDTVSEKIFSLLPDDFRYCFAEGASKLVLLPDDKDYVIKIPYNKVIDSFNYSPHTLCGAGTCIGGRWDDEHSWDYCFTETILWRMAKKAKVEKAFAKEVFVGTIDNYPIYMQQKVEVYCDTDAFYRHNLKEKRTTRDYCKKKGFSAFEDTSINWQTDALEYFGQKQFDKIMSFIKELKIGDLRENNLGYIGDRPVICDFSDYMD